MYIKILVNNLKFKNFSNCKTSKKINNFFLTRRYNEILSKTIIKMKLQSNKNNKIKSKKKSRKSVLNGNHFNKFEKK